MGPIAIRRLAVAAAAVPAACGLVATALYFLGGGMKHPFDAAIFVLGFPGVLFTPDLPMPEVFEPSSELLRWIWDPALVNFLVLWGPIAGLLSVWPRAAAAKAEIVRRFSISYPLVAVGLLYAVLITFLSFGFTGGGHGWLEAMYAAPFALVLCPALGAAIGMRGTYAGRTLLLLVIVGAVFADVTIYLGTDFASEFSRFRRVADSPWIIAWLFVWFFWQGYAVNMLFQRQPSQQPEPNVSTPAGETP